MFHSLTFARIPFKGDIASAESKLIALLQPPLNLTGWSNKQRAMLLDYRRVCTMEAKQALGASAA